MAFKSFQAGTTLLLEEFSINLQTEKQIQKQGEKPPQMLEI